MNNTPKNIQRDATFINPKVAERIDWGAPTTIRAQPGVVGAPTTVAVDYQASQSNYDQLISSLSAGEYVAIGVQIAPPNSDRTPYRVKAYVGTGTNEDYNAFIMVGYNRDGTLPAGQGAGAANASVNVTNNTFIPFEGRDFNDIIIVETPDPATPDFEKPLVIALAFATTSQLTNFYLSGHISVQNLGVKPPTMQNAVS